MIPPPGLYVGTVRHRRFTPQPHRFEYSLFMAWLDVDRVRQSMAVSKLTGYNRWNWAVFDERDHLGDPARPLRERLRDSAIAAGHVLPDGPIYLLTHLRYAGYVFNPISLFYCYGAHGDLRLVLAEVSNNYGGRRNYWLHPGDISARRFRAVTTKSLYVSPFVEYDVEYEFVLTPPGRTLIAHMTVAGSGAAGNRSGRVLDATLALAYQPLTAKAIRGALYRFPWMTAKVIAAIHWQALRLRLKGLKVFPFPQQGAA